MHCGRPATRHDAGMSGPGFFAAIAALTGAIVLWRGSRIAGAMLLAGALVVLLGIAGVSLPSRPGGGDSAGGHRDKEVWVLRVTLDGSAPAGLPHRLSERWVDVPSVGSARPAGPGQIVV